MEHKLITGGEQFLPFARSRIKALQATGLKYASQQFEVDGCSIKVRIEPGQEFIAISGGVSRLSMDSGVVDMLGIGSWSPQRFLPGILYETKHVADYSTPFFISGGGKYPSWRRNQKDVPFFQFVGAVETGARKFAGRVLPDQSPAASFSPKLMPVDESNQGVRAYDTEDTILEMKKVVATTCPASIFTGRCRLYIQAMYGQPLYEYEDKTEAPGELKKTNYPPELVTGMDSAPALKIAAHVAPDDFVMRGGQKVMNSYPTVLVDTSSGVRLDAGTGKHWLICIELNGDVTMYPLVSNLTAEAQRKYLAGSVVANGTALDIDEREKLEAYILSGSRPDVKNKFVAGQTSGNKYSMGYGWHWNWAGTKADIVTIEYFDQDPPFVAMRSQHRRIDLNNAAGEWVATESVVEGPVPWAVHRESWAITEPDYVSMTLRKVTPKKSRLFTCDAPVYAFYVRDELKILRAKVTEHLAQPPERSMSESFSASGALNTNRSFQRTLGMNDGYVRDPTSIDGHYTAVFSCGDVVTPDLHFGKSEAGNEVSISGKEDLGSYAPFGMSGYISEGSIDSGYPDAPYGGAYEQVKFTGRIIVNYHTIGYKANISSYARGWRSSATIVIPFMDSQAIYLRHQTMFSEHLEGVEETWEAVSYSEFMRTTDVYTLNNDAYEKTSSVVRYGWGTGRDEVASGANMTGSKSMSRDKDDVTDSAQRLICTAGTREAEFTNLIQFHDALTDNVLATFSTLTGASQVSPVLMAGGYAADSGIVNAESIALPAIVGWA